MKTFNYQLSIGPTPAEEPCAQVGEEGYEERAIAECKRFIAQIRKEIGPEPEGARIRFVAHPHDFGQYYDVVVDFNDRIDEAVRYAYRVESDAPLYWDEEESGAQVQF